MNSDNLELFMKNATITLYMNDNLKLIIGTVDFQSHKLVDIFYDAKVLVKILPMTPSPVDIFYMDYRYWGEEQLVIGSPLTNKL